jgi:hypothetical protein
MSCSSRFFTAERIPSHHPFAVDIRFLLAMMAARFGKKQGSSNHITNTL